MTTRALTKEERRYWEERKKKRILIDMRGKTLTPIAGKGVITEIEEELLKMWVTFQDSPDEIIVDDLAIFSQKMIEADPKYKERAETIAWRYKGLVRFYLTKFSIDARTGSIPVFDTV